MGVFFFIFIIFLFLVLFASSVIFSVIRWVLSLLGLGARGTRRTNYNNAGEAAHQQRKSREQPRGSRGYEDAARSQWHFSPEEEYKRKHRKKIISPDEGEYVDFEEVKK